MPEETTIEFSAENKGDRIDKLLVERLANVSRSAIQQMIRDGLVLVNGAGIKPNYRTRVGDQVVARVVEEPEPELLAEPIPLDVVYEDDFLLVVNKPAGMVVHPAFGHNSGTLVNAVLSHVPDMADEAQADRPGIVHRLDMDTSGLIVVAKQEAVRIALQEAFKEREIKKQYLVLVEGQVAAGHGVIRAEIGRDPKQRKRMTVVADGRAAVTEYRVLERFERQTYLEAEPQTGRTHQIRVHFAYIGHPVVGDRVYGYRKQRVSLDRQFLHAARLVFVHPVSGDVLDLEAPLPADLAAVLDDLRRTEVI